MGYLIAFAVVIVGSATAAVVHMSRRYRWRWGRKHTGKVSVGDHMYRAGWVETFEDHGIPRINHVLSWFAIAWALLTAIVFAPAGLLFCLVAAEQSSKALASFTGLLGVFLFACHGFALTAGLMRTSKALLKRSPEVIARTARWSLFHHVGVTASFALASAGKDLWLVAIAGVPCALGAIHALAMDRAAERMTVAERNSDSQAIATLFRASR